MHSFFRLAKIVFFLFVSLATLLTAKAQSNLVLAVSRPTNAIPVGSTFTYSIFLTNTTAVLFNNIWITNTLPASVQIVNAVNNSNPGYVVTDGNTVSFFQFQLQGLNSVASMSLTVKPLVAGFITNAIVATSPDFPGVNIITNIANQVTNVLPIEADLGVSINLPAKPVLVNDFMTYGVVVTNRGPGNATNVFLTNSIPGAKFSGTNQSVINLGNISNGGFKLFNVQVQPTNFGTLTFSARVGGGNVTDTNTANDFTSTNITVGTLQTNILVASNVNPAMVFNPQNSLMEQTVRLMNISATNIADSARVIVTGLAPTNWLYNAVGTNDGNPFVAYTAPLAPGESVDLKLQYFIKSRTAVPMDDTNYIAVPTSAYSAVTTTNFTLAITNIIQLPSQAWMIEFPATKGKTYTILYSSDISTNTLLAAQPPIVAQADKVQWIDDGPPTTISHPTNALMRFYRVLQNP